jgi:hypothetical protein
VGTASALARTGSFPNPLAGAFKDAADRCTFPIPLIASENFRTRLVLGRNILNQPRQFCSGCPKTKPIDAHPHDEHRDNASRHPWFAAIAPQYICMEHRHWEQKCSFLAKPINL